MNSDGEDVDDISLVEFTIQDIPKFQKKFRWLNGKTDKDNDNILQTIVTTRIRNAYTTAIQDYQLAFEMGLMRLCYRNSSLIEIYHYLDLMEEIARNDIFSTNNTEKSRAIKRIKDGIAIKSILMAIVDVMEIFNTFLNFSEGKLSN